MRRLLFLIVSQLITLFAQNNLKISKIRKLGAIGEDIGPTLLPPTVVSDEISCENFKDDYETYCKGKLDIQLQNARSEFLKNCELYERKCTQYFTPATLGYYVPVYYPTFAQPTYQPVTQGPYQPVTQPYQSVTESPYQPVVTQLPYVTVTQAPYQTVTAPPYKRSPPALPFNNQPTKRRSCVDKNPKCCEWAKMGGCDNSIGFMRVKCEKSCGTCGCTAQSALECRVNIASNCLRVLRRVDEMPEQLNEMQQIKHCIDYHPSCVYWTKNGECSSNKFWMRRACRKSCNSCLINSVKDINHPEPIKGCHNNYDLCQYWSEINECKTNKQWMTHNCRLSCGKC